jgi:tRNA/tmRNA/rRNA uracil-C5-methylase (TrmA/RlmC/RlmD family)
MSDGSQQDGAAAFASSAPLMRRITDNCLVLPNAGPWLRRNQLRTLLEAAGCTGVKEVIKNTGNDNCAGYVRFESDAQLDAAFARFPLLRSDGKGLSAKYATRDESFWEERKRHDAPRATLPLMPAAQCPDVHTIVTPLAHMPYADQLQLKRESLREVLATATRGIVEALELDFSLAPAPEPAGASSSSSSSSFSPCPAAAGGSHKRPRPAAPSVLEKLLSPGLPSDFFWLREAAQRNGGLPCALGPVLASPVQEGYRNKAEFAIGLGPDGKPSVGFRLGGYGASGGGYQMPVGTAPAFRHMPPEISAIRAAADAFFKGSPLPPYDSTGHVGVWRQISVRWCHASGAAQVELQAAPPADAVGAGAPESSQVELQAAPPAYAAPVGADAPESSPSDSSSSSSSSSSLSQDPQQQQQAPATYQAEVQRFIQAMADQGTVQSLFLQEYSGRSTPDVNHPRRLLLGVPTLTERLPHCNLSYRVSPGAFAQVNHSAADILYFLARSMAIDGLSGAQALLGVGPGGLFSGEGAAAPGAAAVLVGGGGAGQGAAGTGGSLLNLTPPTTRKDLCVLDICCGGGSLGICCAPYVGIVCGVDIAEASIADARENSRLNGVAEGAASWVCGKAETAMEAVLKLASEKGAQSYTGIVDPPRSGLHPAVIRSLRTLRGHRRLVYVSCKAESFVADAVKLCSPPRKNKSSGFARGPPFRLVWVCGVDLFPHTPGLEVVGLFERD